MKIYIVKGGEPYGKIITYGIYKYEYEAILKLKLLIDYQEKQYQLYLDNKEYDDLIGNFSYWVVESEVIE